MLMRLQKYSAPLICFAVLSDAFTNDEIEKKHTKKATQAGRLPVQGSIIKTNKS
jgi:hypothetical protein